MTIVIDDDYINRYDQIVTVEEIDADSVIYINEDDSLCILDIDEFKEYFIKRK